MKIYKFLNEGLKSSKGDCVWKLNEWKTHDKDPKCCEEGFHGSVLPLDALKYINGSIVAIAEVKGKSHKENDKQAWEKMRLVKAYHWTKTDSVELAIFSAALVTDIFEKKYPKDDRPRKAIEAAKAYVEALNGGDEKKINAATATAATAKQKLLKKINAWMV